MNSSSRPRVVKRDDQGYPIAVVLPYAVSDHYVCRAGVLEIGHDVTWIHPTEWPERLREMQIERALFDQPGAYCLDFYRSKTYWKDYTGWRAPVQNWLLLYYDGQQTYLAERGHWAGHPYASVRYYPDGDDSVLRVENGRPLIHYDDGRVRAADPLEPEVIQEIFENCFNLQVVYHPLQEGYLHTENLPSDSQLVYKENEEEFVYPERVVQMEIE